MQLDPNRDLAYFEKLGKDFFPDSLGVRVLDVRQGGLQAELDVSQRLLAPNGFLHAAAVVGLADTAAGYATFAHLPPGASSFTTLELKCNFIGTARAGRIECSANAVHLGRTSQVWDAIVTREGSEAPIALFRCTQMILWPR